MKKWWIGMMMLLALVLMQSTAMAATKCPTCNAYRTVKYTNDYEYLTEKMHKQIGVCSTCNTKLGGKFLNHTESLAATCTSPAYCNQCQHYYGLKNMDNHNWSEWQPNQYFPNQHYRYCLNSCGASENEPHDGNSNCVTSATCSKCHATYKDTTKHAGPFTYTYEKIDESFHKRIETCTACGNKTGNQVETRHEEEHPANCTYGATCKVCMYEYGEPNPDNHSWSNWIYGNENQHYRFCIHNELHNQYADHRGDATCIVSMPCLDCGYSYKDPDKHQGGTDFDYTNVSDTEHKVTVTCGGCHGEIKTYQEGHSEHTPATCSSRAICAKCSTPFGDLAPNNHIGEATTTYVKTSESQHTERIKYSDCGHTIDGASADHTETTAATCTAAAYCAVCKSSYGSTDPNNHVGEAVTHYSFFSESQHKLNKSCLSCGGEIFGGYEAHTETTAATCTAAAYCAVCKSSYGDPDPDAHDLVQHDAQAPTCTEIGWNAYEACQREGCGYTTYVEKPPVHDLVQHDAQAPTCTEIGWNAYEACQREGCGYTTYSALDVNPNNHVGEATTTYVKTSETQHTERIKYSDCGHTIDGASTDHTETTAATCTAAAYCDVCKSSYGEPDPDAHDLVQHDAQAPTCFHVGWNAYEACQREGCGYTTYVAKGTLVHWYGEWTPNADGTHSATCRYGCGYRRTVPCACFTYQLNGDPVAEYTLCPVCGEVNDGKCLTMADGAKAAALTRTLPGGEVVVRVGVLSGGEAVMSVAFESAGCLTKPTGQVKINLPAEWLEGYALRLLAADGTETELTFDVHKEEASFVLDFTDSPSAVRVIRLVPVA